MLCCVVLLLNEFVYPMFESLMSLPWIVFHLLESILKRDLILILRGSVIPSDKPSCSKLIKFFVFIKVIYG